MSDFILEVKNVSKRYGKKQVLSELNLQLPVGGVHAVVGGNGAGKSTLFRVLLGLVEPTFGSVKVMGCDSSKLDAQTRAKIAYVNEDHDLPPWMSVAQLVAMQKSHFSDWCEKSFQGVIGNFFLTSSQKISQLSRGERAGLSLAIALAQKPKLLILDEPTLGLDVVAKQSFLESLLFVGASEHCTTLFCSHHMEEVERIADTLVLIENGEVKEIESPESFCERVEYWIAEFKDEPPAKAQVPNLLQVRNIDGIYHYMVLDSEQPFEEFLMHHGAKSTMRNPVSLDRAVNAYLTRGRQAQQLEMQS